MDTTAPRITLQQSNGSQNGDFEGYPNLNLSFEVILPTEHTDSQNKGLNFDIRQNGLEIVVRQNMENKTVACPVSVEPVEPMRPKSPITVTSNVVVPSPVTTESSIQVPNQEPDATPPTSPMRDSFEHLSMPLGSQMQASDRESSPTPMQIQYPRREEETDTPSMSVSPTMPDDFSRPISSRMLNHYSEHVEAQLHMQFAAESEPQMSNGLFSETSGHYSETDQSAMTMLISQIRDSTSPSFSIPTQTQNNVLEGSEGQPLPSLSQQIAPISSVLPINYSRDRSVQRYNQSNPHVLKQIGACPICFESTMHREPTVTKCGHVFCRECISKSLAAVRKCPLCQCRVRMNQLLRIYL